MLFVPLLTLFAGAAAGAAGTVGAVKRRRKRRAEKRNDVREQVFTCLSEAMPVFFAQIRRDLEKRPDPVDWEFAVYPALAGSDERRIVYYEYDYPAISSMVATLVDAGYVEMVEIAAASTKPSVYRFRKEFVARLMNR